MHRTIFLILYKLLLIFLPTNYGHHNSQICKRFHKAYRHFLDDNDSTHHGHAEFLDI